MIKTQEEKEVCISSSNSHRKIRIWIRKTLKCK